jgi:hypothetical protein
MKHKLGEPVNANRSLRGELVNRMCDQTVFALGIVDRLSNTLDVSLYRSLSLSYKNTLWRHCGRASSLARKVK